ncbi:MAG: hypothetical protein MUP55_00905 [Candidatus Aenigmarchaeota archaeon]|nr:hypothetical protein [Candidatus Aenigmarchaeota archaeon]
MKLPSCPRTLIINILRKHPDGLTLTSIAELTGLHRHTATKYVYELKGAGIINERDVGSAKLCYLKEGFSKLEEKKVVSRLNGGKVWQQGMKASRDAFRRKSSTGQVQLLSIFFLLFLVPASVIIAQNATMNVTSEGNLVLGQINISENADINFPISIESNFSETVNLTQKEISFELNETAILENITETSNQTENLPAETIASLDNETILPDAGIFENETDNITAQEPENWMNETIQEPEPPLTEIPEPVIEARILSPDKITRGKSFDVSGVVKNSGNGEAKNVRLSWEIPSGFELVSGEIEKECGTLPPDSECTSNLTLSSSLSTETGRSELKVLVKYEE